MLSDLKLDIVPIPAYVHETWVMTETLLVHSGYTYKGRRGEYSMTLRDKVCSCNIRRVLNVEPLLRREKSQLRWFSHVSRISHKIERGTFC